MENTKEQYESMLNEKCFYDYFYDLDNHIKKKCFIKTIYVKGKQMKMSNKTKVLCLMSVVLCLVSAVVFAVGTTRISGQAGAHIDLKAYLAGNLSEAGVPITIANETWSYGTGANAVNVIYADTITLADDANDTLDFYASGTLVDVFNRTLTMTAIKLVYIKNNSADATLQVFGGASNDIGIIADTSDIVKIKPGGSFIWVDPSAAGLVITTNKNLRIEHDGTGTSTMAVDIIVMGLD
jgi:hypothetical protein